MAFSGPGFLVAVGYMDPGNWATDLAGGARFGYSLLCVIMISNLMAILLQHLCIKLGVATGRDLAQACRDHYPRPVVWFLWILCEIAIAACDLAEVVGSAIALQLLFGIPLVWGCLITALDVLAVLYLQNKGFRYVEALVITLIATIGTCFALELIFSKPSIARGCAWVYPWATCRHKPGNALRQHRYPWGHRNAAQSVFALVHCADAEIRADAGRQARSYQVCNHRFERGAHVRVVH